MAIAKARVDVGQVEAIGCRLRELSVQILEQLAAFFKCQLGVGRAAQLRENRSEALLGNGPSVGESGAIRKLEPQSRQQGAGPVVALLRLGEVAQEQVDIADAD